MRQITPCPECGKPRSTQVEAKDLLGRAYLAALLTEDEVHTDEILPELVFREQALIPLFREWKSLHSSPKARLLEDETHRTLTAEILAEEELEVPIEDLLIRLRGRVRAAKGQELKEAIQEAEAGGDVAKVERMLKELHSLKEAQ